jgi:hypothetical protein
MSASRAADRPGWVLSINAALVCAVRRTAAAMSEANRPLPIGELRALWHSGVSYCAGSIGEATNALKRLIYKYALGVRKKSWFARYLNYPSNQYVTPGCSKIPGK